MILNENREPINSLRVATGTDKNIITDSRNDKIVSILTSIHIIRIFGVVFLIGVSQGIIASTFGYVAGIGDILIGVTAVPVAYTLKKRYSWAILGSILWNILGMTDLAAAIYLGVTTSQLSTAATAGTMVSWPWILIPTVGVPSLLTIHITILWFLKEKLTVGKENLYDVRKGSN
jgi:hypothetical protein